MTSYRRYGYIVGILILLGIIVVGFFFIRGDFSLKDSKTYTDIQYGFKFDYPAAFILSMPFPEAYSDGSLSQEEQERLFQQDQEMWRKRFEEINKGVIAKEGDDHNEIDVSIMDPAGFPTRAEDAISCEKLKQLNPEEGEETCLPEGIVREDLEEEKGIIMTGALGTTTPSFHKMMSGGTLIERNGIRGIRSLWFSSDTGEYNASFTTYTSRGERVSIDIPLVHYEHPPVISADDQEWRGKAEHDPRNAALDQIISSFKFL